MSIFKQVAIYFLAPLALAICHSVCAIGVLSNELFVSFGVSIVQPVLMAALLVVGIYGGYMLITFLVSKSIVKSTDRSVA